MVGLVNACGSATTVMVGLVNASCSATTGVRCTSILLFGDTYLLVGVPVAAVRTISGVRGASSLPTAARGECLGGLHLMGRPPLSIFLKLCELWATGTAPRTARAGVGLLPTVFGDSDLLAAAGLTVVCARRPTSLVGPGTSLAVLISEAGRR